jgi:hypothetical protein
MFHMGGVNYPLSTHHSSLSNTVEDDPERAESVCAGI